MLLKILLFLSIFLTGISATAENNKSPEVTIYKSPYCGCCTKWAEHLTENGMQSKEIKVDNVAEYKKQFGVPDDMQSCHTSVVDDYFIEGHVPAEDVARLLKERPDIKGLAVPGMPIGSPGMEIADKKDQFDVIAIKKDGSTYIFNTHNAKKEQ